MSFPLDSSIHGTPQGPEPVVGIDMGGTQAKIAWFDAPSGVMLGSLKIPTRDELSAQGIPLFADDLRECLGRIEHTLGTRFRAIGVSAPGVTSNDKSCISSMPGRLTGLVGLDWMKQFARQEPVPVLNDGHAAILGERWKGAARGCRNALLLTLGTGVGGAIIANGKLLRGATGRAGHLGHLSLNPAGALDIVGTPGSLEDAIGECSLSLRTRRRFKTTKALLDAANSGDVDARRVWDDSIQALAAAIVSLINIVDPERIIIGGGVAQAGDALFVPLRARVAAMEWRPTGQAVPLLAAELGEWSGATGAAWAAQSVLINGTATDL